MKNQPRLLHRVAFLFLLVTTGFLSHATNYYFSSTDGDDSRSVGEAQNPSSPWKSLAKLNAVFYSLRPGDSVLFKCGDVFRGSILATTSGAAGSPIVFASYGQGDMPIISGLAKVDNWQSKGGNVWETNAGGLLQNVNTVLVNGNFQPIGRYPNADAANGGYLKIDGVGASSLTSNALTNRFNWSGGEVVIRKNRWIVDRNKILSQIGNTLLYASGSGYGATNGYGFFVQNHPDALDKEGEWYYQNGRLGIYLAGSPNAYSVEASAVPVLVSIYNQSNLLFTNLRFRGANTSAFDVHNANNISLQHCAIDFSGVDAIDAANVQNLQIAETEITYTNNVALNLSACNGAVLQNNHIANSGSIAGMGNSGDGTYSAVVLNGNNNRIEGNIIENTGYVPVSFNGSSVTVKNNFINKFTLVKDDGAGIYTWNNSANAPEYTDRAVVANVVLNGNSASAGTDDDSKKFSHGIYLDDNAANVEVSGNTVAANEGFGIYVHNAKQCVVKNNTAYNNTVQLSMVEDDIAPNSPIRNTELRQNIFFSLLPSQSVAEFKSRDNDLSSFGVFDGNYYCRPFDENATIGTLRKISGNYVWQPVTLDGWKSLSGMDAHSLASPKTFPSFAVNSFGGGNKFGNGNFANNIGGLYSFSPANNCQTSWNNGALDGGSLAVNFSSITNNSKGTVVIGVGALTAGKKYLLRFSVKGGAENKLVEAYLRKSGAPYNDVSDRKQTAIKATRGEAALLFVANESTSDGSIGLDIPEQNSTVYFDNVDLREVDATDINPQDSIKFVYNASASAVSTNLSLPYIDVKNAAYNNAVTTQPFSSVVLLANNAQPVVPQVACSATGNILREEWDNVGGNDVSQIPVSLNPSSSNQLTLFEGPRDAADNYGSRIRGYICPPQSGSYIFFIAGDDGTELWLSSDSLPANKTKIAYSLSWTDFREWTKYSTQKSTAIYLEAGKKYYVEALQKEGNGGDNLSVAWQLPDGTFEAPISGTRLSPFVPVFTDAAQCSATGTILREEWDGVGGNDVVQIPIALLPSSSAQLRFFEGPRDAADNYGSRIHGYLCAPQTGLYTFWIAGDDATELWLSANNDEWQKTKIAYSLSWTDFREWNKYATQKSAPVYLEAGHRYYIEALQKEGGGGDHLSVAWQLPDGTMEAPINGSHLSPFVQTVSHEKTTMDNATGGLTIAGATEKGSAVIKAYPNPFRNNFRVTIVPVVTAPAVVELTDVAGRVLQTIFQGTLQKGAIQNITVNSQTLLPGFYFVRYKWSKGSAVCKINKL